MGKTALRQRGANKRQLVDLTDRQHKFCVEYLVDFNATQAAIRAGYAKSRATAEGHELLKHPVIQAEIGRRKAMLVEEVEVSAEEVLRQLYYAVTRSGLDFVDENNLIRPIKDMPKRLQMSINSIKQDVETWIDDEGVEHRKVKTEVRVVPKETAIDMLMKHFGQYAAEKKEIKHSVDWDSLYEAPQGDDPVEKRIELIDKPIETDSRDATSGNIIDVNT